MPLIADNLIFGVDSAITPSIILGSSLYDYWDCGVGTYEDAACTLATTGASDIVGGWKGVNGNILSQATLANKPVISSTTLNGINVLQFNGTSNYLSNTFPGTYNSNAYYLVCNFSSVSVQSYVYDGNTSASRNRLVMQTSGIPAVIGASNLTYSFALSASTWYRFNSLYGTSAASRVNSGTDQTGSTGSNTVGSVNLGSGYQLNNWFGGVIAAFLVTNTTITPTQRNQLDTFFTSRFGF